MTSSSAQTNNPTRLIINSLILHPLVSLHVKLNNHSVSMLDFWLPAFCPPCHLSILLFLSLLHLLSLMSCFSFSSHIPPGLVSQVHVPFIHFGTPPTDLHNGPISYILQSYWFILFIYSFMQLCLVACTAEHVDNNVF